MGHLVHKTSFVPTEVLLTVLSSEIHLSCKSNVAMIFHEKMRLAIAYEKTLVVEMFFLTIDKYCRKSTQKRLTFEGQ